MTISDYIRQRFQASGQITDADLLGICLGNSLNGSEEISKDNIRDVDIAIAKFIPSLLLRPKSISENGFSISYDFDALKTYYSLLCIQYDLEDELNAKSIIIDRSNLW